MKTSMYVLVAGVLTASGVFADIDVDFATSGTGVNALGPGTSPVNLTFSIDGSGNVSLDATGVGANDALVNDWDNASAGTVSAAALFGTSFTLGLTAPGGLRAQEIDGTIAVGNGQMTTGEELIFTLSGTATAVSGFQLNLSSMNYGNRQANGQSSFGVTDADSTVQQLVPNTSTAGSILTPGITLVGGESMSFHTIEGNLGGVNLAGFTMEVIPEPATLGLVGVFGGAVLFIRRRFMI